MLLGVLFLVCCLIYFREEIVLLSVPLRMIARVALTAYAFYLAARELWDRDDWLAFHRDNGSEPL